MTARRSIHLNEPHLHAASVPLQLNARPFLVVSLFFILAGNISLTASDEQSSTTAIIRAAGLATGIGCLLIAVSRQADVRVGPLVFWLSPFIIFIMYCTFSAAWSLQPSATLIRSSETMTTIGFAALWTHVAVRQYRLEKDLYTWIALAVLGVALYGLFVNTVLFGGPIRIVVNSEESDRARFVF